MFITVRVLAGFMAILMFVTSQRQLGAPFRGRIPGYCRPTLDMILRGQRRLIPVGRSVKPNHCVICTCTTSGTFECCLNKRNAGKTFVFPGPLCTRCQCAELPFQRNFLLSSSILEEHCFRGNNLMTCVTSLCVHPLVADPNCIQVRSNKNECCDHCVRSGCYIMLNGTIFTAVDNQLAINNVERDGVEMIKMDFGESIQTGCLQGSCLPPDFLFNGGFVINNSSCNSTS